MMISSLSIFLAVAGFGLVHSLLASQTVKSLAQRWLGASAGRVYRLFFNFLGVLTLLPALALLLILPDRSLYAIPRPWVYLTLIFQGLAVVILLVGVKQTGFVAFSGLGQLADPDIETRRPLVTDGLYRWVRHPLYSAGLVFIWLIPHMTINLLALNLGLSLYIFVGTYFEERKLLNAFDPAYAAYQRRTPLFFPGRQLFRRT
jgi:protein-S-isoprenylcysteine O-methyltransferase Ste14